MPVYEFACNACGARVSVFVRSFSSRVAVLRSGGDTGSMDDLEGLDESDPRAMAAWARRMRTEMGDDAGPEMDEMIDRLERGESLADDGLGGNEDDDDF